MTTPSPLALFRAAVEALVPLVAAPLTVHLAEEEAYRGALASYAAEHGLAEGRALVPTVAASAGLLALLKLVNADLAGFEIPAELSLAARLALADESLPADYERSLLDSLLEDVTGPAALPPIAALALALREAGRADAIGALYEEVVPQPFRRKLGQFWTPPAISELMASWAIQTAADRVLEPSAGSGRLMLAAIARLTALGTPAAALGEQLQANEISELVRTLMVVTLRAAVGVALPGVALADFMTTRERGGEGYDAVVANPPYTRHHLLDPGYKEAVRDTVAAESGVRLSGFASLFAHFYLHGLALLRPGGRAAYITPAELFEASYARPIQAYVLDEANLRSVISFADDLLAFEGVDAAGVISLTETGPADETPVAFVTVAAWPGTGVLLAALAQPGDHAWGRVELRSRAELRTARKWIHGSTTAADAGTVSLGSLARVMRGIATGANDFFTLTEAERLATGIHDRYLTPVLCKTRDATGLEVTEADLARLRGEGRKAYLFGCYEEPEALAGTPEGAYIAAAEARGLDAGSLVSKRSRWYQCERRPIPAFLYTYMSRGNPRFVRNTAGAAALNSFLHVSPRADLMADPVLLDALAAILNAPYVLAQLREVGRSYGGGTVKVEPRELDRLRVLDPARIPRAMAVGLAGAFRRLVGGDDAAAREIDQLIVAALAGPPPADFAQAA